MYTLTFLLPISSGLFTTSHASQAIRIFLGCRTHAHCLSHNIEVFEFKSPFATCVSWSRDCYPIALFVLIFDNGICRMCSYQPSSFLSQIERTFWAVYWKRKPIVVTFNRSSSSRWHVYRNRHLSASSSPPSAPARFCNKRRHEFIRISIVWICVAKKYSFKLLINGRNMLY